VIGKTSAKRKEERALLFEKKNCEQRGDQTRMVGDQEDSEEEGKKSKYLDTPEGQMRDNYRWGV